MNTVLTSIPLAIEPSAADINALGGFNFVTSTAVGRGQISSEESVRNISLFSLLYHYDRSFPQWDM